MPPQSPKRTLISRLVWLTAIGVAFGQIEAAVTVYARHVMEWVPLPEPLSTELLAEVPGWMIVSEQARQVAALLMLLAISALAGRIFLEKVATLFFASGVWGIAYYAALRIMIDWPNSLAATDCISLLPSPWFAPVWLALCAAAGLMVVGLIIFASIERYSAKYGPVGK